ncbi:MAG: IS5 family transposase [Byssovorax sp.]
MQPRKPYPSDLTDAEYAILEPLVPPCKSGTSKGGRPEEYARREILNAICYVTRSGCAWRMMPHDLPPWDTAYHYFRKWRKDGTWVRLHEHLRGDVREAEGRAREPSAGILDSQSVKTTERGGLNGYDAGKKINGRKRHILVDTLGLLIAVVVHPANVQDRDGAKLVLQWLAHTFFARMRLIWADAAYAGALLAWVTSLRRRSKLRLEIVKRTDDLKGFKLLPRRWVVERTFGWLGRYRRLSKDYEFLTATSETMIHLAMIRLMVRRPAA